MLGWFDGTSLARLIWLLQVLTQVAQKEAALHMRISWMDGVRVIVIEGMSMGHIQTLHVLYK